MVGYRGMEFSFKVSEAEFLRAAKLERKTASRSSLKTAAFWVLVMLGLMFLYIAVQPSRHLPGVAAQPAVHQPGMGSSRVDLQACKLEYSIVSPK